MTERRARLALLCAACGGAWFAVLAETRATADEVSSSVMIYSDDDGVQVIAPSIGGTFEGDTTKLGARYTIDIVTAASVDLLSGASPRGFEETRHQVAINGEYALDTVGSRVRADYGASLEPDYTGQGVGVGYQRDFNARLSTLNLHYGFLYAAVSRVRDTAFARTRTGHEVAVVWTEVLGQRTVLDLTLTGSRGGGFLANPYRQVKLYAGDAMEHATAVAERVPDERDSAAGSARLRVQLLDALHALGEYQLYGDRWGMLAHTVTARAMVSLARDRLLLTAEGRLYWQGAADFYRGRFETFPMVPVYRSADKELGRMRTVIGGIDLEWTPDQPWFAALRLGTGLDVFTMRYPDHPVLRERTAFIWSMDLTLELE